MDKDLVRFWPLTKIQSVRSYCETDPESFESGDWFIFADYSIDAALIAIRLSNSRGDTGPVRLYAGIAPELISRSFSEFIELYSSGDLSWLHS